MANVIYPLASPHDTSQWLIVDTWPGVYSFLLPDRAHFVGGFDAWSRGFEGPGRYQMLPADRFRIPTGEWFWKW